MKKLMHFYIFDLLQNMLLFIFLVSLYTSDSNIEVMYHDTYTIKDTEIPFFSF